MAYSMTGFGRASLQRLGREITVELKSVNHRYLDLGFRMPRHICFLEDELRRLLSARLSRGHVDVFVTYRNTRNDAVIVSVDTALLGSYLSAGRAAASEFGLKDDLTLASALRLQGVTDIIEAEEDREALIELIRDVTNTACDELIEMRRTEGDRLCANLYSRLDSVEVFRSHIEERAPSVTVDYRNRLNERIANLLDGVEMDEARLATEVAIFADKANIDEELVRLKSHISAAKELMSSDAVIGRKFDFIVQEMNREFNTIGSKANDREITSFVIEGKAELEKIREQVQNLE